MLKKNQLNKQNITLFWFRRDLRLEDNTALYYALKEKYPVYPIFIRESSFSLSLDSNPLRKEFLDFQLERLNSELENLGTSLFVYNGKTKDIFKKIISEFNVVSVYFNSEYEPDTISRDHNIKHFLNAHNIDCYEYKDNVIFEKLEVAKSNGEPYTVFTPYMKKWLENYSLAKIEVQTTLPSTNFFQTTKREKINNEQTQDFVSKFPSHFFNEDIITNYDTNRDFPARNGTSKLGVHLRFGTISIRKLMKLALNLNQTYLKELIWREFYMMLLFNFPYLAKDSFKKQYNNLILRNSEADFELWCKGQTGYPMVDAGIRELNETGFMHNRSRMITSSFLTKHLLVHWQWGEAYFASKLLDYELASNNGGWQWAASSGCDAVPYFRIFNPITQQKKFDPDNSYVNKWIPEIESFQYPKPMVEHKTARERALQTFEKAFKTKY